MLKPRQSIRWMLATAFGVGALFIALFVAVAIVAHAKEVERASQLEASDVAELMADTVVDEHGIKPRLQDYVSRLSSVDKRDFVIVDRQQIGLADAHPDELGLRYDHDLGDEIGRTIDDGRTRVFVETNDRHVDGARQIVVPIRLGTTIVGAVVLEYTAIRNELFDAGRNEVYLVLVAGGTAVLLVTLLGFGVARRIVRPLADLKDRAVQIAAQDYAARVVVISNDEIGVLGLAFNKMAGDLGASHAQLVEFNTQLDDKVEERTKALGEAAIASLNMMQDAEEGHERLKCAYDELNREMTERKKFEQESRDLGSMVDKAQDAIFVCDMDQRILSWNTGATRMYGWSAGEAIGRKIEELLFDDPAEYRKIAIARSESDDWTGVLAQVRKDGSSITVEGHKTLFRDENGSPKSILTINTDITTRLALQEKVQQSQRLDAIGQLTGGVAHDFNNLLTVIFGNSELLVEQLESQPRLRELASMTMAAAQRGADLTHRLLAFARRQPLDSTVVDLDQLLANMGALLRRTLSGAIGIEIIPGTDLWPVIVDASQLENAVLNLALNARDAMPAGGRLIIGTSNVMVDQDYANQAAGLAPGRYVLLSVTDTGKGIRREDIKRVFEPFFTTKEFGKGTGLGLSMIYGFVMQSHGHVSIYSEPGRGTTVKMYFPTTTEAGSAVAATTAPEAVVGGVEKILMVEDDDAVRRVGEEQLHKLGYSVVSVADGVKALEVLRQTPDFALLFTDMVMPGGMNGTELASAALAIKPALKILYSSGYVQDTVDNKGSMPASSHFLGKPYSRAALAAKIRSALSDSGAAKKEEAS